MKFHVLLFRLFLLLPAAPTASAATLPRGGTAVVRIGCYNVESLYDTVADPLVRDAEYTPEGRKRWNTTRYREKIGRLARVIDDLGADLLALAEVENEQVVRDLVEALGTDYNYIHRHTGDRRGMDMALLYKGALFFPDTVWQMSDRRLSREPLVVGGTIASERLTLVVCHMPSQINRAKYRSAAFEALHRSAEALLSETPGGKVVLLGDFNTPPDSPDARRLKASAGTARTGAESPETGAAPLLCPFDRAGHRGCGSYAYRDRWLLYDYMLLSPALVSGSGLRYAERCGIFVRDYMLHAEGARRGYPRRSFDGTAYTGGSSDHLPVFIELEMPREDE